jgi:hypothetical protein
MDLKNFQLYGGENRAITVEGYTNLFNVDWTPDSTGLFGGGPLDPVAHFAACPPSDQRLWITMQQAAATLGVSEMVVRRLIAQKTLPAKQIVKFAPWMIDRTHLELPAVRKEIRRVHVGRRLGVAVNKDQTGLFSDSHESYP